MTNSYQLKFKNEIIAQRVVKAEGFVDKLMGLMFSKDMGDRDGLMFDTTSIHTHFMKYPIDVIFLTTENRVLKIFKNMKPWRMTGIYWKAAKAIELRSGTIGNTIQVGDEVEIVCIN